MVSSLDEAAVNAGAMAAGAPMNVVHKPNTTTAQTYTIRTRNSDNATAVSCPVNSGSLTVQEIQG